jgi:hypothetical protein
MDFAITLPWLPRSEQNVNGKTYSSVGLQNTLRVANRSLPLKKLYRHMQTTIMNVLATLTAGRRLVAFASRAILVGMGGLISCS